MGNEAYTEEYLDDGDSSPLIKVKRNVLLNRGKVRDLYHGAVNQSENDVFSKYGFFSIYTCTLINYLLVNFINYCFICRDEVKDQIKQGGALDRLAHS